MAPKAARRNAAAEDGAALGRRKSPAALATSRVDAQGQANSNRGGSKAAGLPLLR